MMNAEPLQHLVLAHPLFPPLRCHRNQCVKNLLQTFQTQESMLKNLLQTFQSQKSQPVSFVRSRVEKASGMHLQLKEMEINEMRTEQFPSSRGTVVQVWFKSP